jgi:hypothetical protein
MSGAEISVPWVDLLAADGIPSDGIAIRTCVPISLCVRMKKIRSYFPLAGIGAKAVSCGAEVVRAVILQQCIQHTRRQ